MTARAAGGLARVILACVALGAAPPDDTADDRRPPGRVHVSSNLVGFPVPGLAELTQGHVDAAETLRVKVTGVGNNTWELYVYSPDADLGNGKPLNDLLWREAGASSWNPVGNGSVLLRQGQRPDEVEIEFRMLLDWFTDSPGTYGGDVSFELYVQ